ncbi:MAG TPA: energy transducer TonB [Thermoanaerobaculia bacterium]|nr:energy transducer TonB [Thermoanaerobaculia bacterium]
MWCGRPARLGWWSGISFPHPGAGGTPAPHPHLETRGEEIHVVAGPLRSSKPLPEGVRRVDGVSVTPPRVLVRVDPIYPAEAKLARVSGLVILEAIINEAGAVENVRVLKGLPFGLDQAALEAVRQWTFSPGTADGKPVSVVFNLTVNFRLADGEE